MSNQQNGGWLTDGLQQVKAINAEKAARDAEKAPKNPTERPKAQPKEKPRMSMRDKILAATKGIGTASGLRNVLQDAKDCQASQVVVDRFVALIREINEIAVYKLGQEMSEREAHNQWESMTWDERETQLVEWAEQGDLEVQIRMESLPEFYEDADGRENAPTKIFLHEVVDQFVNPLRWINTMTGLRKFLDELVDVEAPKTPVVKRIYNPRFESGNNGVRIKSGRDNLLYIPKPGVNKIARAWPYIKEVEARAKDLEDKVNGLRAKATPEFTPVRISHGEEGCLFLSLSGKEAVLMQAERQENGEVTVGIVESIGVNEDDLPDEPQLWDKKLHRPASNDGKWRRVCKALDDWKVRREETTRARKQARNDLLAPLTKAANISARFEDQGLTRIIKGEQGTVSFWRDNFHWGKSSKFFGIAVEHCENETYVLKAVVSDFAFPKELIGERLPLAVDHQAPSAKLEQLPKMNPGRWNGLRMVEKLLGIRLEEESRYANLEEADASEQECGVS